MEIHIFRDTNKEVKFERKYLLHCKCCNTVLSRFQYFIYRNASVRSYLFYHIYNEHKSIKTFGLIN